jgi:predicted permease
LREEIEQHLAMQAADNRRAGLSPIEAHRRAALTFGSVEGMKERYREQRTVPSVERLIRDTSQALRRLRMAPAFTVATVLTLALGIGATTSIFTLVNAVLLKSLPVANPDELYRLGREPRCCYIGGYSQDKEFSLVSYDLYRYLQSNTSGFSELAAFPSTQLLFGVRRVGNADTVQSYPGEFVSGNYFTTFGVQPYAGRLLTTADDARGAPPVAVMSYRLWQQRYGADLSVIGSTFNVNEQPFTVVGITPQGFFGETLRNTPPDFFLPLNTEPLVQSDTDLNKYDTHWLALIGRIQPGVTPAAVEVRMRGALTQWLRSHWGEMSASDRTKFPEQTLFLSPGGSGITSMRQQYGQWLVILMAVTAFVLLIVCANVANLMLVRSLERRQQIALSMALGAPVSRVVSQPLIESLLLSLAGGAAGLVIAFAGTRLILQLAFPSLPGFAGVPIEASPSLPVLLFASVTSFATGVIFGIGPAWMAARVDPIETLRGSSRATTRTGLLPRKALVVFQAALSLVLLSMAGLLTAALHSLETQTFGFEQDRRVVVTMNPKLAGYRAGQLSVLYGGIRDGIANMSGVSSVALCLYTPPGGGWGSGVWIDGHPPPGPRDDNSASWNRVTPDYFTVIGTPLLKGRSISAEDTAASRKVAVVTEAFVRKFLGNDDPIGQHFGRRSDATREFEIIGVARDARYFTRGLDQPSGPLFFLPEAQAEYSQTNLGSLFLRNIVIETQPGASVPEASIRQAIASVAPGLPITSIRTLGEHVSAMFTQPRLIARLASLFGMVSLIVASIGLYGVTAYHAGRRTKEIGVRMALGASPGEVVQLILRGALGLVLLGLSIGLPLTFVAGKFLGNQLYGTSSYNPSVTLVAIAMLGCSATVAALVPAWRATMISPLDSVRAE